MIYSSSDDFAPDKRKKSIYREFISFKNILVTSVIIGISCFIYKMHIEQQLIKNQQDVVQNQQQELINSVRLILQNADTANKIVDEPQVDEISTQLKVLSDRIITNAAATAVNKKQNINTKKSFYTLNSKITTLQEEQASLKNQLDKQYKYIRSLHKYIRGSSSER